MKINTKPFEECAQLETMSSMGIKAWEEVLKMAEIVNNLMEQIPIECPWCKTDIALDNKMFDKNHIVECQRCGCIGPRMLTKELSIKAWNNR